MVSPGKAEAILHDRTIAVFDDRAWQFDLTPRTALVGSALYRDSTNRDPQLWRGGRRAGLCTWLPPVDLDRGRRTAAVEGRRRAFWVVINETAVEVYRGIWLKVVPTAPHVRRSARLLRPAPPRDSPRICCRARTGT